MFSEERTVFAADGEYRSHASDHTVEVAASAQERGKRG